MCIGNLRERKRYLSIRLARQIVCKKNQNYSCSSRERPPTRSAILSFPSPSRRRGSRETRLKYSVSIPAFAGMTVILAILHISWGTSKLSCKFRRLARNTAPLTVTHKSFYRYSVDLWHPVGVQIVEMLSFRGFGSVVINTAASPPATLCAAVGGKECPQNFAATPDCFGVPSK